MENNLEELYANMQKVHEKATMIFQQDGVPSMLKNEYRNKVSQYDEMLESVETLKKLCSKPEAMTNFVNQQMEILNVRIKWELDLAKRALGYL